MKATKIVVAAALFSFATAGSALAFHSGGVAECEGCHTMHNSFEGVPVKKEDGTATGLANQYQAGPYLLKANDQSSACLNCHESTPGSYHISTPTAAHTGANTVTPITQYTPGGDFAWLKQTYTYTSYSGPETSAGERHGHNIIAADYGYAQDGTQTVSPGGSYNPANFYCSSCHDPHGRYRRAADNTNYATTGAPIYTSGSYGSAPKTVNGVTYAVGAYRILGGNNYKPKSLGASGMSFTADPPLAIAPSSYNTSDTSTLAGNVIVKYGSSMSEWCGNCHGKMVENGYTSGMAGLVHPAGNSAKLSAGYPAPIYQNYNNYVTSGVMTGGTFTNLVPFETGDTTTATLKAEAALPVAGANSNVMCLSCHRAHASGFNSMLRFDPTGSEFMTILDNANLPSYNGTDINGTPSGAKNQGRSIADWTAAYNGRPASVFGAYQRVLCNKCHAKD
jgi:predicted CXXCH cytochrome family protein